MARSPARPDLSAPRPWRAEPSDPHRPDGDWRVVAPARYGRSPHIVAAYLSEEDARLIADAPRLQELLHDPGALGHAGEQPPRAKVGGTR